MLIFLSGREAIILMIFKLTCSSIQPRSKAYEKLFFQIHFSSNPSSTPMISYAMIQSAEPMKQYDVSEY